MLYIWKKFHVFWQNLFVIKLKQHIFISKNQLKSNYVWPII